MSTPSSHPGELWDRRYRESGWSAIPDVSLVELVAPLPAGRALDLGCGTGRNALWLARAGWRVTGVDASSVGLAMAHEQAAKESLDLTTVQADLTTYEPEADQFDLVVIANIHLGPQERDILFARAARAVAPGGHLYIVGHHVDALGHHGPPVRENLFELALFEHRFIDFTTERLERQASAADNDGAPDVVVLFWAKKSDAEPKVAS